MDTHRSISVQLCLDPPKALAESLFVWILGTRVPFRTFSQYLTSTWSSYILRCGTPAFPSSLSSHVCAVGEHLGIKAETDTWRRFLCLQFDHDISISIHATLGAASSPHATHGPLHTPNLSVLTKAFSLLTSNVAIRIRVINDDLERPIESRWLIA